MCVPQRRPLMRYCRHDDGRCLDGDAPCDECDAEGYLIGARRRLKRAADDTVDDIDDGQRFRVKRTTNKRVRLVPVFNRGVKWRTEQGFTVMQMLLSCLGARGEYVLWDGVTGAEMDVSTWMEQGYGASSKVPVRHSVCTEVVTSTCIASLQQGQRVGCTCNSNQAKHWRHRRSEVVEIGKTRNFEVVTSEEDWVERCDGNSFCPTLRCLVCNEIVTSTCITNVQQGQGVGCTCNHANHWRHRRSEVVEIGKARNFEVVTSEEEWLENCNGSSYCPTLRCLVCTEVVTSTCIDSLQKGHGVGCTCNSTYANHWRHRRSELVEIGKARNFEVVMSEEEWLENCNGCSYCPTLRCTVCNEVVTTTSVHSLRKGQGVGCNGCRNKTEGVLLKWLQTHLPSVSISPQHRGPKTTCGGQTHFDFLLTFSDGFRVLLELDGPQHFWVVHNHTDDGCERDLIKERWALQQGLCVIRVLQEDVWNDRYDWQGWILRSIEAARECEDACVFTPDAPEYRDSHSAYVKRHSVGTVPIPSV